MMRCAILFAVTTLVWTQSVLAVVAPAKGENPWIKSGFTKANLLRSAVLAADYLQRIQLPDGDFVYVKDPMGNCCKQKPNYSMVRHFGAVYALLRLAEIRRQPELIETAKKGLEFAERFAKRQGNLRLIRGFKAKVSLGELGFFLMDAMLYEKLTGDRKFRPLADDAAQFVVNNLHSKSKFLTKGIWAEHQALIGLANHYQQSKRQIPGTIKVIEQFLEYTVEQNRPSHWSQMAFAAFAQIAPTKVEKFKPFIKKSTDKLLDRVISRSSNSRSRFVGSKSDQRFSGCGAAARNEGLIASMELLRQSKEFNERLTRGIRDHLGYSLQFQYGVRGHLLASSKKLRRMANLFNLHGGIFNSPEEGFIRIDFVAHHIRAIVDYLENF